MALKSCKECGSHVSSRAPACPQCGAPIRRKSNLRTLGCLGLIILGGFFVFVCSGVLNNGDMTPRPRTPTSESSRTHSAVKSLPYTIVEEKDISFGRILAKVVIRGQHSRDTILATAKAVIEEITAKRAVNAISVFFYTPTADTSAGFDVASVGWAPDGEWGKATNSVTTGDYSRHRYHVAYYYPPPRSTVQLAVADDLTRMGVPIPAGATLVKTRDQTDDDDAYEKYEIEASRDDLAAFFLQHLPAAGWASYGRSNETTFYYKRGNCKILLGVKDGSFWVMGDEPPVLEKAAQRAAAIEAAKWRTWTTVDGKHTVEAKFVKFAAGTLTLEKKSGTAVDVKLDMLCPEDQEFVKKRKWEKTGNGDKGTKR